MKSQILIIMLSMLCILALIPSAKATTPTSYVLHPNADLADGWIGIPDNVDHYNDLQSNDGMISFVWAGYATWTPDKYLFPDLPVSNGTWKLTFWLWAKDYNSIGRLQFAMQDYNGNGWSVRYLSTLSNWANYTWTFSECPWTGLPWTPTDISTISFQITDVLYGTGIVTEIGILATNMNAVPQVIPGFSVDILMYLLAMIILLVINFIGYSRIPYLCFIGIIGTSILAYPTVLAFKGFEMIALILILVNIGLPIMGLRSAQKGQ